MSGTLPITQNGVHLTGSKRVVSPRLALGTVGGTLDAPVGARAVLVAMVVVVEMGRPMHAVARRAKCFRTIRTAEGADAATGGPTPPRS